MNDSRAQAIFDGLPNNARKVYAYVPDEPTAASKIHNKVRAECNFDLNVTKGCLGSLAAAGLIRQVSKDRYERKAGINLPVTLAALATTEDNRPKLGDIMAAALHGTKPASARPMEPSAPVQLSKQEGEMLLHGAAQGVLEEVIMGKQADRPVDPLSQMADLTRQLLDAVDTFSAKVKVVAKELEDVALAIESEREHNSKAAGKLKRLQALLVDLEN